MEKEKKQRDLFAGDEEFNRLHESDIKFPFCTINKKGNIYTCYLNEDKFQEITISQEHESFMGNILFGFNESIKSYKGDLKLWYYCMMRNNTIITQEEYDNVYNILMEGFNEFMSGNSHKYVELLPHKDAHKFIKHRWKPIQSVTASQTNNE